MIQFVTDNTGKFREIAAVLPGIEQLKLELDEIQSLDPRAVIEHKLAQAATLHSGELIVEDTSLTFSCLNELPGTMIKWFLQALGNEGMAELVHKYADHSAVARCTIGYRGAAGTVHYFTGEIADTIVKPRGSISIFGWNSIFEIAALGQTFAEMTIAEKNELSMRGQAAKKLAAYLKE